MLEKQEKINRVSNWLQRNKHTIAEYETGKVDVADIHDEAVEMVDDFDDHDCSSETGDGCEVCGIFSECGILPEGEPDEE